MPETLLAAPPPALRNAVTAEQAWHYRAVPKEVIGETLVLYADRTTSDVALELELVLGRSVRLDQAPAEAIDRMLGQHYRRSAEPTRRIDLSARHAEHVLGDLAAEARELGSSDIHLEVYEDHARVRIRIDGQLAERYRYAKADHPALVNKVKVQAGLDISEKRLPQDGRMLLMHGAARTEIRISVLPTLHGEKVVLRLLGQDASRLDLARMGMSDRQLLDYRQGIQRRSGIVLLSGPTGSGKTTTLYATLKELNEVRRNILTIEDPIEYTLPGINQVQLKEEIGLDFPRALRAFLRQDPNVIMVGEIRDGDTAQMAIRLSLTGHLVLSTIHTNSAWGTVARLVDMGVPAFLIANTLNLSVAQRLVRTLCERCKRPERLESRTAAAYGPKLDQGLTHCVAVGCPECHFTGYAGRVAVHEVLLLDHALSAIIRQGRTDEPEELAKRGIQRLRDRAMDLVMEQRTSLEEAIPLHNGEN
jgi:general secretion pathway protein E/type IV pilus assembly protein PilB